MVIKVKKRDTATVDYDETKIYAAIEKAVKSSVQSEDDVPQHLVTIVKDITTKIDNIIKGYESRGSEEVDVEHIQDLVEQQLMGAGLYEVGQVRVQPTGKVSVYTGAHSHGQGHETTFPQACTSS